jgi:hypothetical protein
VSANLSSQLVGELRCDEGWLQLRLLMDSATMNATFLPASENIHCDEGDEAALFASFNGNRLAYRIWRNAT